VLHFWDHGNVLPTFTRRFNRALDDSIALPGRIEKGLQKSRKNLEELEKLGGERFAKDGALKEAEADLRRLNKELMEIGKAQAGEESAGDDPGVVSGESGSEGADGGGGATLYSGIPLPEMLKLARKFKGVVSKEDMNILEQHTAIPSWMSDKYPEFRPLYDLVQDRRRMKTQIQNTYLAELLPAWQALTNKEKENVGRLLGQGDAQQRVLSPAARRNLSDAERNAYDTTRDVLDFIWMEDIPELIATLYDLPKNRID
jgi:hypothetical protein